MKQNKNIVAATVASKTIDDPDANQSGPPSRLEFEPVTVSYRSDGWTPEKQRAFIEELAECGIVREAAARVGMTEQSAGRLRRRDDAAAFNFAWEAALQIGTDRLRSIAYERAVTGTVRRQYYHGKVVGEERVYDNRLLIYLLGKGRQPLNAVAVEGVRENWNQWMAAIEGGFAEPVPGPDEAPSSPVWQEEDGSWWTDFPPPEGFDQLVHTAYGDEGYCRPLAPQEQAAVELWIARGRDEDTRQRDRYFESLE